MKALRGTKRVCHACAARFYDLSREPIVCPSCGVHYVPNAPPVAAEAGARSARFTDKTGWRGRSLKHPEPDVAPEEVASTEEALIPTANEDVVLDEEQDEADIPGLLGHHEADPKEG
ncbi:MAG: TIGR02300 family protein [Hyphomicrobiaceae bacterium]